MKQWGILFQNMCICNIFFFSCFGISIHFLILADESPEGARAPLLSHTPFQLLKRIWGNRFREKIQLPSSCNKSIHMKGPVEVKDSKTSVSGWNELVFKMISTLVDWIPLLEQFSRILSETHRLHGKNNFEADCFNVVNFHFHLPKYFNKSWKKKKNLEETLP